MVKSEAINMSVNHTKHTLYLALQSTGVLRLSFDPNLEPDNALVVVDQIEAGIMPGWLTLHGNKLYSISRTNSTNPSSGEVFAFQTKHSGIEKFALTSAHGEGGVHIEVSPNGKILAAATITGNTLSFYRLDQDGNMIPFHRVQYDDIEGQGVIAGPHQVAFDPTGLYIVAPLRTLDRIDIYMISSNITKVHSIELPKSTGPRHVAFRSCGLKTTYLYAACEKDNSLRVFSIQHEQPDQPEVKLIQTLSVLGANHALTEPSHENMAGEIAISRDTKFLYVSNRSTDPSKHDTIAVFSVGDDGRVSFIQRQSIGGLHPRMFALSPDLKNQYIAVCNQFDQIVAIFERDCVTGLLGGLKGRLRVSRRALANDTDAPLSKESIRQNQKEGPMCVQWEA